MRLAAGSALIAPGVGALLAGLQLGPALVQVFSTALGIFLLAGLWTPIVGALVTVEAVWNIFTLGDPWRWTLLGTLDAALALIGPGAWSLDARLFGWKRLEIPTRKS